MDRGLGIATFIGALASRLARREGWHVVFYGPPALAPAGCTAVWPPPLRFYPSLDLPTGRRLARRHGIDVMHFTANSGWMQREAPPFVLTIHDAIFLTADPARSPRQRAGHAYQAYNVRRSVQNAAAVVAPSRSAAQAVQRALGLPAQPFVIPNGVEPVALETSLQVSPAAYVAFGGRDPRKRLDLVVDAWRASGTRFDLYVLAGAGLPPGFAEANAVEIETGRIRLLPYLSPSALASVLSGAAALIYPSENEGFGLPVIEAMAQGTSVITGGCEATVEMAGDAALLIDMSAPVASISHAIRQIEQDPALRESLVRKGRIQAARFSWDACANAYAELYSRVSDSVSA